jgi:hypothetical protein
VDAPPLGQSDMRWCEQVYAIAVEEVMDRGADRISNSVKISTGVRGW